MASVLAYLAGFDDQELLAAHCRPPLTTVRVLYFEMGAWGVDQLIEAAPSLDVYVTPDPASVTSATLFSKDKQNSSFTFCLTVFLLNRNADFHGTKSEDAGRRALYGQ